ncbi:hypothetical protein SAMD00019534_124430 [Acytostelium subglobosum LB1]|uniref:hypothetical protein n=1 Tax=Acytostelium subglobosum LB1 TaxID=1410327 RepID=UPI000644A851|nr:hypothetical protein SAMD00019534_124430 [Acytostelium subglobosum LB1]GAM29267.1 hypothetical protein SAMD00019534_124430 [Acytostelium subglobosum LB1]|eukprot:XP_012747765.1 hypothetical protein SAMD00019534_124430 [Acytostelium subglobosum LB1]
MISHHRHHIPQQQRQRQQKQRHKASGEVKKKRKAVNDNTTTAAANKQLSPKETETSDKRHPIHPRMKTTIMTRTMIMKTRTMMRMRTMMSTRVPTPVVLVAGNYDDDIKPNPQHNGTGKDVDPLLRGVLTTCQNNSKELPPMTGEQQKRYTIIGIPTRKITK